MANKLFIYAVDKMFFESVWLSLQDNKLATENKILHDELEDCYSKLIHEKEEKDYIFVEV
jgi:hypothetical protein